MKKMKKLTIFTLVVATALLSCTKEQDLNLENQKVALSVKAGIMVEPTTTKSIITGTLFADGAEIGVQVRQLGQYNYQANRRTNVKYTYTASGATWATSTPFYLTSILGEVYAYYPYAVVGDNASAFSTIPVTIDATATTGSETDYLYATPLTGENSVNNETGKQNVDLVMNHSFAQVSFYVYKDNYSGTGSLTQFKIEDAAATTFIKTSSTALTMDITNGTLVGGATGILNRTLAAPVVLTAVVPEAALADLKTQVNATTLAVPTTDFAIGDIKFSFIIDGEIYSATNTTAISWLKGKQYIYTAKLTGTGLVIVSATITDWSTEAGDLIDII